MAVVRLNITLLVGQHVEPLIVQFIDGSSVNGQLIHSITVLMHGMLVTEVFVNCSCLRHKLVVLTSFNWHVKNKVLRR